MAHPVRVEFRRSAARLPRGAFTTVRHCAAAAVTLLFTATPAPTLAQQPPALTGTVRIGLAAGTIAGDICLQALPAADSITVVLNSSLHIRDVDGGRYLPRLSEAEPGGAAIRHVLFRGAAAGTTRPLCLQYEGREEVYDTGAGEYREQDSSEVIAFNGTSVRARGFARWYPALYYLEAGHASEAETFRITIECRECRTIFVNGSAPAPGPVATFESDVRRELLLLAGSFPVTTMAGVTLIGDIAAPDSTAGFVETLQRIRSFQQGFVGVPFSEDLTILRVAPVRAPRRGQLWGFYSNPTLSLIGMSIGEFVSAIEGRPVQARRSILGLLAHELAHRYFGWSVGWLSPQRDLFGEPFATYLELKSIRHFLGEADYRAALRSLASRAPRGAERRSLDQALPLDFSYDEYRYAYAPALLITLEHAIGEARMRMLLRAILTAPPDERARSSYASIRQLALSVVGVSEERWADWERSCVLTQDLERDCFPRFMDPQTTGTRS